VLEVRAIVELTHTLRFSVGAMGDESRDHFEFLRRSRQAQRSPMTPSSSLLPAQTIGAQLDDLLAGRWLPATCQTRIYSLSELPLRVNAASAFWGRTQRGALILIPRRLSAQ
jgi:hypothetical protein